ncbi:MAG: tetratricopeptide repeat protein [Spirosomataceae bacterium]
MNTNRLALLQEFYQEDPNDPFNAYALAMEYLNHNPTKAWHFFDELLVKHPDYLPTYYQAAELMAAVGKREQAKEIYEKGIILAQQSNQPKALGELRSAYEIFLMDEEE